MKTTITDLIYFLPIDSEVKAKLLSGYDSLDNNKKLTISKICWSMYHDLYDLRVQQEVQKALAESEIDPSKLSQQMVKDIEKKINDEFQQQLILKQEESNIGQVREDLESLVTKEIVASSPTPVIDSEIITHFQPQNPVEAPVVEPAAPVAEPSSVVETPPSAPPLPEPLITVETPVPTQAASLPEPDIAAKYRTETPSKVIIQHIRNLLDELENQVK